MGFESKVHTRTPHADYTEKYNMHMDNLKRFDDNRHLKKVQNRIQDYHEIKHTKVVESHNNDRKLQLRKEMDSVHQYEVLSNRRNYYDYKYMFYVGTLFDIYI